MTSLLVAGATGLVGRAAVGLAATDGRFDRVAALVRRPADFRGVDGRLDVRQVDWSGLDSTPEVCRADAVLCALGSTLRAAGSRSAFRRVDFDYVVNLARLARAHGASHFLLVSAIGADPRSRAFYTRVKGEVEAAVAELGYPGVTIARPSFLAGVRDRPRLGERIGVALSRFLPDRWASVPAASVASALLAAALEGPRGLRVMENPELRRFPPDRIPRD
ncbi:MAG TPA: NAD(P)H-binding protein [Gemmatimonadales bacterium]|nr:NAD(P)H-binding protein [Gemmatimonadales bacterium]